MLFKDVKAQQENNAKLGVLLHIQNVLRANTMLVVVCVLNIDLQGILIMDFIV